MNTGRTEKWRQMQQMGKARFIWRERVLLIGVPVCVVAAIFFGFRPSSLADWITADAVKDFWIPLVIGLVAGALYGHAEWDYERHEAEKAEKEGR